MRVLDDDRDPRIDDLPVDADTHNDVDLERAGQHRRRDLREPQLGQASGVRDLRDLRLGAGEAGTRRAGPNAAVAPGDVGEQVVHRLRQRSAVRTRPARVRVSYAGPDGHLGGLLST